MALIFLFLPVIHISKSAAMLTIGFMGDVMIGRLMNDVIKEKGSRYPWGNTLPVVHAMDLNIANLETALTRSTAAVPKVFNYKSDPEHVQVLKEARINVVNLANNHSKDFGSAGLVDTLAALDAAGIAHVGAGLSIQEAQQPVIITKQGIKIGIIGATDNEPDWAAGKDTPGVNYFNVMNVEPIAEQIKALKKNVDIVIVALHWGPNMRERPTKPFIDAAHAFVDAGADIIFGSSAHIFQGIEQYKQALIMYDTGDFVDDYRIDSVLRNDLSFFFEITLTKNGPKELKLIPIKIENLQVNVATGDDARWSLERIQMLSQELGTEVSKSGFWQLR